MFRVIDSHTAGQPTRVIVEGGPDLGSGSINERADRLRSNFDRFRTAVVREPRGSDALVGALLCNASDPANTAGAIFFDNAGYPAMSGHAMIGFIATLEFLGRIRGVGAHRIETPAGLVTAEIHANGEISIQNVASFRYQKNVTLDLNGMGNISGDVAWGGNWFFIAEQSREPLTIENVTKLTNLAQSIRQALERASITCPDGNAVKNVALFGPASRRGVNSRNFVLRPGQSAGRSPCGTATSAKL